MFINMFSSILSSSSSAGINSFPDSSSTDGRQRSRFARIIHRSRGPAGDGCVTASNHSVDQGEAGVIAILDTSDAQDLGHAGA